MTLARQNADGSWSPAEPLPLTDDFDVEVYGTGPYRWQAWVGMTEIASGRARTRLGLRFAIARAKRQHARSSPQPAPTPPHREPRTHAYTPDHRGWGHNSVIHGERSGGLHLRVSGWGHGIEQGDHLLINYDGQPHRYRVTEIEHHRDPAHMSAGSRWCSI